MQHKPFTAVRKHKRDGTFLVLHYADDPTIGALVAWGSPDRFTGGDFRLRALDVVYRTLQEFAQRKDPRKQIGVTRIEDPQQQVQQAKAYLNIGVTLENSQTIVLSPTHRERGGYVGVREEEIRVQLPCNPKHFFERIEAAFASCS